MGIIDSAYQQLRAWNAATALSSDSESERRRAMQTLRELGQASLPALHSATRRALAPRAQFSAAVVLHWLGDSGGLKLLIDALVWQLPADPILARDLEAAFNEIDAADAINALTPVWIQAVSETKRDNLPILRCICRIWQSIGDPTPLPLLIDCGDLHPDLVEEFVPTFKEDALPYLEVLSVDPLEARRMLAVRTLRRLPLPLLAARRCVAARLRDPVPAIRALAAEVLDVRKIYRDTTERDPAGFAYNEILCALQEGYSSAPAIEVLVRNTIPVNTFECLLELVLRWNAEPGQETYDTLDAVILALQSMSGWKLQRISERAALHSQLRSLLERTPRHEPRILAAVAWLIAARGSTEALTDQRVRAALFRQLIHPEADVRAASAQALATLGEPVGRYLQQLLETHWPQGNWREKLHVLLRGDSDMSQVASEAMQWFNRKSRETMERLGTPAATAPAQPPSYPDQRLIGLLRDLLANALALLQSPLDNRPGFPTSAPEAKPTSRNASDSYRSNEGSKLSTRTGGTGSGILVERENGYPGRAVPEGQPETMANLCIACIRALIRQDRKAAGVAQPQILACLRFHRPFQARSAGAGSGATSQLMLHDAGEALRIAAGQALIALYGKNSFSLFLIALYQPAIPVRCTAIEFLGELADVRALPHLQIVVQQGTPVLASVASEAVARIRAVHPETMTLLRASSAVAQGKDILLRPASGDGVSKGRDQLLRPTEKPC